MGPHRVMGNGVINNRDLPEDAQMFVSESHEGERKNRMQFDIMKEAKKQKA